MSSRDVNNFIDTLAFLFLRGRSCVGRNCREIFFVL